jgi:hypothetical protein
MYENVMATICPVTGTVTMLGQFVGSEYANSYASDFDPATGRYFTHMYNAENDTYHIVTYNVNSHTAVISAPIGAKLTLTQIVQYFGYDPVTGNIFAVANSRLGTSVLEIDLAKACLFRSAPPCG